MREGPQVAFYVLLRLYDSELKVFYSLHTSAKYYPFDNHNKRKIIKTRLIGNNTK